MKNVVVLILASALALSLGACKKKQIGPIREQITKGTWMVTRFSDNDVEKTFKYTDDIFTFQSSGIVAVNGSHTLNGYWNLEKENGGLFKGRRIIFQLTLGDPLSDLAGDWEVESYSDTRLELKKDDSGSGDDVLVLEQN